MQHVPHIKALGKKTYVNDQAYAEPHGSSLDESLDLSSG